MNEQVKDQFNKLSSEYDERRRLLIPHFEDFYKSGIGFVSYNGISPKVLDIGAGTGIFTEEMLIRYPRANITLIDFADDMLGQAREKFKNMPEIKCISADYNTYDFGSEKFDIIISALSIHHLDPDHVRKLYKKTYDLLPQGGEFINADLANSGIPEIDSRYDALWSDFVLKGIGAGENYEKYLKSKEVDKPLPVSDHYLWLREAGFNNIDCVFRYYNFSVLYGKK